METETTMDLEPIIFNATINGEQLTLVYDYVNMSLEQCFDAETKWMLFNKLFTILPNTPDEYQKAVLKLAKSEAMASLLTIKKGDDVYEYEARTAREALSHIKTADKARLEKAKENFLSRTDIISVESVMQYADTMRLANVSEEYKSVIMSELKGAVKEFLGETQLQNFIQQVTNLTKKEVIATGE